MDLNVADLLLDAQNGLTYINDSENFPIVGNNAATGLPEESKGKTELWFPVDQIYSLTNGKFGFPKIPDARLEASGITEEEQATWRATFNITVVENAGDLIPTPEEE